jgi:hypothetical protein
MSTVTRGKSNDLLYAYLAGIVDADGYIGFHISRTLPKSQRRLTPRFVTEICVTNTDRPLIDLLTETFPMGRVYTRPQVKDHHKVTYSWRVANRGALHVAECLEPFLRQKQRRAQITIEFYTGQINKRVAERGALVPEEVERRWALYEEMRAQIDDRRPQRLSEEAPLAG